MRRWRDAAGKSLRLVAERPELWLPGALAWTASVGWIPFVIAVVRPPSVAELTFLGARIVTSGTWPWNAVLLGVGFVAIVILAFTVSAGANAVLLALLERRAVSPVDVRRVLSVDLVSALPAAIVALALATALVAVAPHEFNAPEPAGGPVLRTIARLSPYLLSLSLAIAVGASVAAVAGRLAVERRVRVSDALRSAPGVLTRPSIAAHAVLAFIGQLIYLAFAALLLAVLWAPIGARLAASGEFGVATGLLLVGFVAIWFCLVLAGGALQAWSAATWSRLLATDASGGP